MARQTLRQRQRRLAHGIALLASGLVAVAHGQPEYLEERLYSAQQGIAESLEWLYLIEVGALEIAVDLDDPDVQRELEAIRALDALCHDRLDVATDAFERGAVYEAERELERALAIYDLLQRRAAPFRRALE